MQNNTKKEKKSFLSTRAIIIAIISLLIAFFIGNKINDSIQRSKPVDIKLSNTDRTIGNINSKVSIIEYADFQCPACKAFEDITTPIISEYKDKVSFTFKNFPLTQIHQNALNAAHIAEAAANQDKFWEMKKELYKNQESWAGALDARDKILNLGLAIGLDKNKLDADSQSDQVKNKVANDLKEAVALKLQGTPSFIINGIRVDGAQLSSVEKFKAYLDKEIEKNK